MEIEQTLHLEMDVFLLAEFCICLFLQIPASEAQ